MLPVSGVSRPAMMRSRLVLPQPDGPSSATSSPLWMLRSMLFSAWIRPKRLLILLIWILMASFLGFGGLALDARLAPLLEQQDHQRQGQQQAGHAERGDVVVFVVENLDVQWQGVGQPADMPGHHRYRTELAHRPRSTEHHAVDQAPFDIGQGDVPEHLPAAGAEQPRRLLFRGALL